MNDGTFHLLVEGDARDLSFIDDESVHLVVTSPPYWTLKKYDEHPSQMGHIADYEGFVEALAGRNSIGIEIAPAYCEMTMRRLAKATRPLFGDVRIEFATADDLMRTDETVQAIGFGNLL